MISYKQSSSAGGITYNGDTYKKSAYFKDMGENPMSKICIFGNNGRFVSVKNDVEQSTINPVASQDGEYLYIENDVNYLQINEKNKKIEELENNLRYQQVNNQGLFNTDTNSLLRRQLEEKIKKYKKKEKKMKD